MKKFRWSAARFSASVDKWVTLPNIVNYDSAGYVEAIMDIVRAESVDWRIPTSHTAIAVVDTAIKRELEIAHPKVKVSKRGWKYVIQLNFFLTGSINRPC